MKLEQILRLLWWHPDPYRIPYPAFGNLPASLAPTDQIKTAARGPLGELRMGGVAIMKHQFWTVSNFAQLNSIPSISFSFDTDNVHIEDLTLHPDSHYWLFYTPSIWGDQSGVADRAYLSLRVMGYLVDCWEINSLVSIHDNKIMFSKMTIPISMLPTIWPLFTLGRSGNTGPYVEATWPRRGGDNREDTITFRYSTASPRWAKTYFEQHPRNFFLSLARSRRAPHIT